MVCIVIYCDIDSCFSFVYVMKFMGDYMAKGKTEIDVVHYLLTAAQQYDPLRDEIYCQLIKQTTNNKSERAEARFIYNKLLCIRLFTLQ